MPEQRLAVDVVVLPPPEIMDLAIDANRRLESPVPQKIVLDRESCLPHISLAMAGVRETDMAEVANTIFRISSRFNALDLAVVRQYDHPVSDGSRISCLEISRTPDLKALHEALMEGLRVHARYEAAPSQFLSPPPISKVTLDFLNRYPEDSAYANFAPHITLGTGYGETSGLPILFKADRLALCHLGNLCTCRKILFDFNLS